MIGFLLCMLPGVCNRLLSLTLSGGQLDVLSVYRSKIESSEVKRLVMQEATRGNQPTVLQWLGLGRLHAMEASSLSIEWGSVDVALWLMEYGQMSSLRQFMVNRAAAAGQLEVLKVLYQKLGEDELPDKLLWFAATSPTVDVC